MRSPRYVIALVLAATCASSPVRAFTINLVPGATLAANAPALAAFDRAAASWEAIFGDPVTVNINADLADLMNPNIIGGASSVFLAGGFDEIRDQLVADADADDGILNALPTGSQFSAFVPTGFGLSPDIAATKANLKAMGFPDLDTSFGTNDGDITFNSTFSFDFDNSDGVLAGLTDFETVATHEIGHVLGFVSAVDVIDFLVTTAPGMSFDIDLNPLDLFRFGQGTLPMSAVDFSTLPRDLTFGAASISDGSNAVEVSRGFDNGDGRQASHWRDDGLNGGVNLGVMDPTLAAGVATSISANDIRAFDLIGWDVVPTPAALWMALPGLFGLIVRRRWKQLSRLLAAPLPVLWLSCQRGQRFCRQLSRTGTAILRCAGLAAPRVTPSRSAAWDRCTTVSG